MWGHGRDANWEWAAGLIMAQRLTGGGDVSGRRPPLVNPPDTIFSCRMRLISWLGTCGGSGGTVVCVLRQLILYHSADPSSRPRHPSHLNNNPCLIDHCPSHHLVSGVPCVFACHGCTKSLLHHVGGTRLAFSPTGLRTGQRLAARVSGCFVPFSPHHPHPRSPMLE